MRCKVTLRSCFYSYVSRIGKWEIKQNITPLQLFGSRSPLAGTVTAPRTVETFLRLYTLCKLETFHSRSETQRYTQ